MALATLGLCVRGPRNTCSSKGCLSQGPECCLPTESSPLDSSPGRVIWRGQLQEWAQEAVMIPLADCEWRIDGAFDFGS